MISIRDLRYRLLAIDSLTIGCGITAIIGANGSGKTSLLKLCAGITLPEAGTVLVEGKEPRRTEIGWVNEFPDRNFLFFRAGDEIASPLRFQHADPDEICRRTEEIWKKTGISGPPGRSVRELSGGEKVLVALAAAVITRPRVLILDECDSHLDARTLTTVDRMLRDANVPVILKSTQDMEQAALCDDVIYLKNGRVGGAGKPEMVFESLKNTPLYPFSWRFRA